jgi:hypothetical protein
MPAGDGSTGMRTSADGEKCMPYPERVRRVKNMKGNALNDFVFPGYGMIALMALLLLLKVLL